jgi:hypothetical protein
MADPVLYEGFLFFQHLLTVTFLCVDLIETVVRAKRLPRLRSQLSFKCPICGRDYGHLVVRIQKERDNTAKRSKRYGAHTRATGKRKLLKPV